MNRTAQTLPKKRVASNKLVLSFAVLAATAVAGTAGIATAAKPDKPTQAQCAAAGFTNYGQCVSAWAKKKNNPGGGYGGNLTVNNNISLDVRNSDHSDRNVIQVIINNYFNWW